MKTHYSLLVLIFALGLVSCETTGSNDEDTTLSAEEQKLKDCREDYRSKEVVYGGPTGATRHYPDGMTDADVNAGCQYAFSLGERYYIPKRVLRPLSSSEERLHKTLWSN